MILSLLLSATPIVEAATKADVKLVLDYMFCRKQSARGCTKPIFQSDWAMSDVIPVHRLVITYEGKRYTLQYCAGYSKPYDNEVVPASFEIFERVDGSTEPYVTYSDDGLDGKVDFGGGPGDNLFHDTSRRDPSFSDIPAKGEEHRPYWQYKYDAAITTILEYYNTLADPPVTNP